MCHHKSSGSPRMGHPIASSMCTWAAARAAGAGVAAQNAQYLHRHAGSARRTGRTRTSTTRPKCLRGCRRSTARRRPPPSPSPPHPAPSARPMSRTCPSPSPFWKNRTCTTRTCTSSNAFPSPLSNRMPRSVLRRCRLATGTSTLWELAAAAARRCARRRWRRRWWRRRGSPCTLCTGRSRSRRR